MVTDLLTTPIMPSLMGMTRPSSTSRASVPASIKSSLLTTSSVLRPERTQVMNTLLSHSAVQCVIMISGILCMLLTIGIHLSCQFKGIRCGEVRVCRRNTQDEGVGVGDVWQNHLLDLSLDIFRLVTDRDLLKKQKIKRKKSHRMTKIEWMKQLGLQLMIILIH